jgi:hypothetical protein
MKIKLGLATCWLLACGGSSEQSARPSGETEAAGVDREDPSSDEVDPVEVAGGETSEFSGGDIGACPEVLSSEALPLDAAEIAPWVALAAGHHEQTLFWRREALSDAVRGFEAHTTVSIDVSVLGARERLYGDGGYEGDEFESCRDRRSRQLDLDIRIATADGAVATSLREWYEPLNTGSGPKLERIRLDPQVVIADVDFSGSLELGLDPALQGTPRLSVALSFGAESVFGSLVPLVAPPDDGAALGSSWRPLRGDFPDDGCAGDDVPIGLDDRVETLRDTPRLAFERAAAAYVAESPIPAGWESPFYGREPADFDIPPPTEVEVSLGEPSHACLSVDIAVVYAPLTVISADGRVNVTQTVGVALYGDGGAGNSTETAWVPAAQFAEQSGLSGVVLDPGAVGRMSLSTNLNLEGDGVEGYLTVWQWDAFREDYAAAPRFRWCRGTICSPIPDAP